MGRARLAYVVSVAPLHTYAEVAGRLEAVGALLSPEDALYWFNRLYLEMTRAVVQRAERGGYRDPAFMEALDCEFAALYVRAFHTALHDPASTPRAWQPLFVVDGRADILGLALAGINAHINRDLPLALCTTFEALGGDPERGTPRHADYLAVDNVLASVEAQAKSWLLTDALARLESALGTIDDLLALWSLDRARDAAWTTAELRWQLRASPRLLAQNLVVLDRFVGFASRAVLRPLPALHGLAEHG